MGRHGQTSLVFCAIGVGLALALGQLAPDGERPSQHHAMPVVGDVPTADQIHMIDNLGSFGLGPDLTGSRYAVVAGHLVRVEVASGKILSVLRPLPR